MNRKSDGQTSTDKLLRSKYIDKDKLKTNAMIPNQFKKIMLADLCPEQKLKIGQLIKINELRKIQISQLTEELTSLRFNLTECQSKISRIQPLLSAKQIECDRINEKLRLSEQKLNQKDSILQQLMLQSKQYQKIIDKINKIALENKGVQTQKQNSSQYGVQTKKQKKKCQQIQTEYTQFIDDYQQQKPKAKKYEIKSSIKRQHRTNKSRQSSFSKSELQQNQSSAENNEEQSYPHSKQLSADNLCEEQISECFQDLAKKLMQLKQKNISKLKTQYQQSKAKFCKDNLLPSIEPGQFYQQQVPVKSQHQLDTNQIDDNQLNLLLKSKNFSASRLLTSKGMMSSSQNSRKGSLYKNNPPAQYPRSEINKRQPLELKDYKLNIATDPGRSSKRAKQNTQKPPRQIPTSNYYQSDLMDIVDSLDK